MNVDNEINKYKNGKIYIIYSLISSKVSFGSTIQKFDRRFQHHICYYNGYKKGKYKYCNSTCDMFDELDFNNCKVKLIKNYPCNSKKALEIEEGNFIKSSKNCYNKYVAGRTQKEYREEHAVESKKYREEHADKEKKYIKKYKEINAVKLKQKINCLCGGKFTYESKSSHCKTTRHLKYLNI